MYLRKWGAIALLACGGVLAAWGNAPEKLTKQDAQKLKNPVANTKKSIAQGRATFMQNCTMCHGENGKAEGSLVADATDLTIAAASTRAGPAKARSSTAFATGRAIRCPRSNRSWTAKPTFGIW